MKNNFGKCRAVFPKSTSKFFLDTLYIFVFCYKKTKTWVFKVWAIPTYLSSSLSCYRYSILYFIHLYNILHIYLLFKHLHICYFNLLLNRYTHLYLIYITIYPISIYYLSYIYLLSNYYLSNLFMSQAGDSGKRVKSKNGTNGIKLPKKYEKYIFWLRLGLANAINDYLLKFTIRVVCVGNF